VRAVNAESEALFGYSSPEFIDLPAAQLFAAGSELSPAEIAKVAAQPGVHRSERNCKNKAGMVIPVLFSAASFGADQPERGLVCVLLDLSDRKRLEAELAQAQKLESVGRLAAGVAHEINTPVQFVGDSVSFVRDGIADLQRLIERYRELAQAVRDGQEACEAATVLLDAEQDADLEYLTEHMPKACARALEGVARVASIVRSLKEFAHPDGVDSTLVDLNRALENTIVVARNEHKYVADVETDFGELPPVVCHAGELNQVFLNLIVNAAQAIEEKVAGTEQRGLITVRTRRLGDCVEVAISDTGAGIPEQHRDKLFDQFFTTKPVGKGTGQGLAISRSIVTKHGGTIRFESTLGKGTTFYIQLPVASIDG